MPRTFVVIVAVRSRSQPARHFESWRGVGEPRRGRVGAPLELPDSAHRSRRAPRAPPEPVTRPRQTRVSLARTPHRHASTSMPMVSVRGRGRRLDCVGAGAPSSHSALAMPEPFSKHTSHSAWPSEMRNAMVIRIITRGTHPVPLCCCRGRGRAPASCAQPSCVASRPRGYCCALGCWTAPPSPVVPLTWSVQIAPGHLAPLSP